MPGCNTVNGSSDFVSKPPSQIELLLTPKKNVGFFELAMGLAWRGIWYCILIKLYHSCSVSQLGQSQQLNVPKSCDVWSLYPLTSVMLKAVFHNFPWLMNYEFIYMVKGMWPKKAKYKVYIFTWDSIGIKMC